MTSERKITAWGLRHIGGGWGIIAGVYLFLGAVASGLAWLALDVGEAWVLWLGVVGCLLASGAATAWLSRFVLVRIQWDAGRGTLLVTPVGGGTFYVPRIERSGCQVSTANAGRTRWVAVTTQTAIATVFWASADRAADESQPPQPADRFRVSRGSLEELAESARPHAGD